jgi:hypothetical protein
MIDWFSQPFSVINEIIHFENLENLGIYASTFMGGYSVFFAFIK